MVDYGILERVGHNQSQSMLLKGVLEAEIEARSLCVEEEYIVKCLDAVEKDRFEAGKNDTYKRIYKKLDPILLKVYAFIKKANSLNKEYLKNKFSNVVQVVKYPQASTTYSYNLVFLIALDLILSLMLLMFIALLLEYISK